MNTSWLPSWRLSHTWVAGLLTSVAAILLAGREVPVSTQLVCLAALVAVTGLPHGAVDHLAGRRLLEGSFGRTWPLPFAAGYLLLAGALVAAWITAPSLTLVSFLLLSALHFGLEDVEPGLYPRIAVGLAVVLRGLLPVAGPILGRPGETAEIFSWLLPGSDPVAVRDAVGTIGAQLEPYLLASWILLAGAHLFAGRRGHRRHLGAAFEILALMALMRLLPPLLAFAVYFCGWHSVRHGLRIAAKLDPLEPGLGLLRYALHAVPLTLAALALAASAYWILSAGSTSSVALAQTLFVGLAALTLPHMALHEAARLRG